MEAKVSNVAQTATAAYGQTGTLNASLTPGQRWSLENSATNANDQIAISAKATCTTPSGY